MSTNKLNLKSYGVKNQKYGVKNQKLDNSAQLGIESEGIPFNHFIAKFLLKNENPHKHSCGDVKCGISIPL